MSNGFNFSSIFETALTAAGMMFGGPVGAMAAQMFGQIASQAIESGIESAASDAGLSQSETDAAKSAFQTAAGTSGAGGSDVMQGLKDSSNAADYGNLERQTQKLMEQTRQAFNDAMDDYANAGKGTSKAKGKGDFFTAMAQALGKALQQEAEAVQKKADDLSDAVDAATGTSDDARSDAQNKIMQLQTELSSESMRLNYMATGIQTALAKVGEALTTLGRSQ